MVTVSRLQQLDRHSQELCRAPRVHALPHHVGGAGMPQNVRGDIWGQLRLDPGLLPCPVDLLDGAASVGDLRSFHPDMFRQRQGPGGPTLNLGMPPSTQM